MLEIYLDKKLHWPQDGLNCESLVYEVVPNPLGHKTTCFKENSRNIYERIPMMETLNKILTHFVPMFSFFSLFPSILYSLLQNTGNYWSNAWRIQNPVKKSKMESFATSVYSLKAWIFSDEYFGRRMDKYFIYTNCISLHLVRRMFL